MVKGEALMEEKAPRMERKRRLWNGNVLKSPSTERRCIWLWRDWINHEGFDENSRSKLATPEGNSD
jgi:hypothetical protein